jgi:thioredoxin reductase (NADPH)
VADLAGQTIYDVLIIGGGPTGLTAALYAAREGMKVIVIEAKIVGGMAAITEHIDNYPGFRDGVGGIELCEEMYQQALRFGTEFELGVRVTSVAPSSEGFVIQSSDRPFKAKTVVIATGSDYRHMEVPGEEELIGRGIHFCATCDAPLYKDKAVIVVGGGNSAVQETLFISKFARKITLLVRGETLKASETLINELLAKPTVTVVFNAPIKRVVSEANRFKGLITQRADSTVTTYEADGAFIFIGLIPSATTIAPFELDERGFIKTDDAYMTTVPGIYACGDIRAGSTWQIASAVGEGAATILSIRKHLERL